MVIATTETLNSSYGNTPILPTDADLRIIATTPTIELETQLRNYTKYWVELFLEEMEMCNHLLHTIIHEGLEPHNNTHNILDRLYEIDFHNDRPYFEIQIDGLYDTITYGSNNPLHHRCPNQIDRLCDYIKSIYHMVNNAPIADCNFENNDEIVLQFICSCIWSDGRSWIIEWCRTELQRRLVENHEDHTHDDNEIIDITEDDE
jgi:hypothetical protein